MARAEDNDPGIDPTVLQQAIDRWTAGQLKCRARGRHVWNPYTSFVGTRVIDVHEVCALCKNRRRRKMYGQYTQWPGRWIDPRWTMERYGPDFLLPPGSGRLSAAQKDQIRILEFLNRPKLVLREDEEEEGEESA